MPWLANAYWIKTLTSSLALAIAAAGVALLYGQLGLVSLCQYALLGVGGWVALRVAHGLQWPFEVCVLVAGGVGGVPARHARRAAGAAPEGPVPRARDADAGRRVPGRRSARPASPTAGAGWLGRISGSERLLMPRPAIAPSDGAYFAYVAVWLAAMLALIEAASAHARRPLVGADPARRGGGRWAPACNVLLYQTWAFGLAGVCAGVAGALLAGAVGQLDGRAFAASESVLLFALTVVGGAYHWIGALRRRAAAARGAVAADRLRASTASWRWCSSAPRCCTR